MRFDTLVSFYDESRKHYDPSTHGYVGGIDFLGSCMANVTDIGTNRAIQLFGKFDVNSLVIRVPELPYQNWAFVTVGNSETKYRLQTMRQTQKMATLIVGEG